MNQYLVFVFLLIQFGFSFASSGEGALGQLPLGVYRVAEVDFATPDEELKVFGKLAGKAEIVALGEAVHTNGTFHKVNARLARYLIETKGFRVLALETPHRASMVLSKYIDCDGQVTLSEALQRVFPQFASLELTELYTWVRRYNCSHPKDKVLFTGFDVQQNLFYIPSDEMNTYLAEPFLENYIRKNIPVLIPQISNLQICGPTATQYSAPHSDEELQKCLGSISFIFSSLQQLLPRDQFEISAALVSLYQHAQGQRYAPNDRLNSGTWRDVGLAKMISMIHRQSVGAKMIVIGHNTHVFRSPLQYMKNMGSYLDDEFGSRYFVVANLSSQLATLPFYNPHQEQPNPGSVEAVLGYWTEGSLILNAKSNEVSQLKQGLQVQADSSTGIITPYMPISKLTDLVVYSRYSSVMSVVPGVQFPPALQP